MKIRSELSSNKPDVVTCCVPEVLPGDAHFERGHGMLRYFAVTDTVGPGSSYGFPPC